MAPSTVQSRQVWTLVRHQHGAIARRQLLAMGFTHDAIAHRVGTGRLHPVSRGVYAVGRPALSRDGELAAAVLAAGPGAWVSHETGAEALRVRRRESGPIEVSVVAARRSRHPGLTVHRRARRDAHTVTTVRGIPVSTVPALMVDMAHRWSPTHLEAAINQADVLDLLDPEAVRRALDAFAGQPGVKPVRELLDGATFLLTESELERRFLRLVRGAGLADPITQPTLDGRRVDFAWPERGVIVEVDGLRYHRTPLQQRRDLERDQGHRARGMVPLRFTHWQVRHAPDEVLDGLSRELRLAV